MKFVFLAFFILLLVNGYLSIRVVMLPKLKAFLKVRALALVWLLPLFGAVFMYFVLNNVLNSRSLFYRVNQKSAKNSDGGYFGNPDFSDSDFSSVDSGSLDCNSSDSGDI